MINHGHPDNVFSDCTLCYAEECISNENSNAEKSAVAALAIEELIKRGAKEIPTSYAEIVLRDLRAENDGLRRALDETHAELVRLNRAAQY